MPPSLPTRRTPLPMGEPEFGTLASPIWLLAMRPRSAPVLGMPWLEFSPWLPPETVLVMVLPLALNPRLAPCTAEASIARMLLAKVLPVMATDPNTVLLLAAIWTPNGRW